MKTKITIIILFCLSFSLMGPNCDHQDPEFLPPAPSQKISALCTYLHNKFLFYGTSDMELKTTIVPSGPDTLYIDSEDEFGNWIAIGLLVDDLTTLGADTFPIRSTQSLNTAWLVHKNNEIDPKVFWPNETQGGGSLVIQSFDLISKKIDVKFNCAINVNANTALIEDGYAYIK